MPETSSRPSSIPSRTISSLTTETTRKTDKRLSNQTHNNQVKLEVSQVNQTSIKISNNKDQEAQMHQNKVEPTPSSAKWERELTNTSLSCWEVSRIPFQSQLVSSLWRSHKKCSSSNFTTKSTPTNLSPRVWENQPESLREERPWPMCWTPSRIPWRFCKEIQSKSSFAFNLTFFI